MNFFAITLILNYHLSVSIIICDETETESGTNLTKAPYLGNGSQYFNSDYLIPESTLLTSLLSSHFPPNLEVVFMLTLV